jgi:hypothetical protein
MGTPDAFALPSAARSETVVLPRSAGWARTELVQNIAHATMCVTE